jgi:hypothetical protein
MTERMRPADDRLEAALSDLGTALDWPATPPLAASVGAAVRDGGPRRAAWRPVRRSLVLGLLAALLVAGLAAAIGFALGGLRIITGGPPPGDPLPASVVAERGFGERVSLADAHRSLGGRLLVPDGTSLGAPPHVYYDRRTGSAALAWGDRPGLPADPDSGLGIVITQFPADIGPQTFVKLIDTGARVELATVGGAPGYWIEGGDHFFYFMGADGEALETTIRMVGTTLMWERDGLTLRIEGAPSLEDAVGIAESLEPWSGGS